jgi:predicted acyl esterase
MVALSACGRQEPTASTLSDQLSEDRSSSPYRVRSLQIASFDGTRLAALLYEPKSSSFPGARPGIIFANSWIFDENEYVMQARRFAEKGYVVLSYASRGFGRSDGAVDAASPDDVRDVSALIDWLQANTELNDAKLATAGISYGGGISLLALAQDERIKTAVAMSGWADLEMALYGGDTLREVWLNLLIGSGAVFGRLSPNLLELADKLRTRRDVDEVRGWAAERSALTYIDAINRRQAPVFLANSYQDALFPPRQNREFYDKLTGPKMFYMDKGVHTSSQLPGTLGLPSLVWGEAHRWLDHWLLGRDSGIMEQPPVSFQTPRGREFFRDFPALRSSPESLALTPLNEVRPGPSRKAGDGWIRFIGGRDSGATTGIPLLSDLASAHINLNVHKWIRAIDKRHGAVYLSEPLASSGRLRGSPRVSFWLAPHDTAQQAVVYLYDVNGYGIGSMITHGVMTEHEARSEVGMVSLELNVNAFDIPAGHRIAVAIDSTDPFYLAPQGGPYRVALSHGESGATTLELPIITD